MSSFGSIELEDYQRVLGKRSKRRWWNRAVLIPVAFAIGWAVPSPVLKGTWDWSFRRAVSATKSPSRTERKLAVNTIFSRIEEGVHSLRVVSSKPDVTGENAINSLGILTTQMLKALQEVEAAPGKHSGLGTHWLEKARRLLNK